MAAYAALNSVMYILQLIQHHPHPPITFQNQYMDSLCEIISYLQDFLEKYSHTDIGDGNKALESQIANTAYAAEHVIETHIVDQILHKSYFQDDSFIDLFCRGAKKMIRTLACSSSHKTDHQIRTGYGGRRLNSLFCRDLLKVIKDMYLIKRKVIEIQEKIVVINDDQPPRHIISMSTNIIGSSTVPPPTRKNNNTNSMVGHDDVLLQIMDRLTGHPPKRQILPIVGMGGIGKTTLARHAYDNPLIVHHFHIRIWITISQEYRLRKILLEALSCLDQLYQKDENENREHELGDHDENENREHDLGDHELGFLLHKSLCGRRYLIILDDMWSIEAWENLMLFFPDNNNGSRIIITTRLLNVSTQFGSLGFKMDFLDEDKSWNLLCKIVFEQDQCCCLLELEDVGKKIARNCKGLPLSIAVIGGLLRNSKKTQKHWEYIAENVSRIVNLEDDKHCLKILYLSYNHLPIHLKPCFLYLGFFPEDKEISVSFLIRLWVSEGFLKPIATKSLEVVAEEYLKDLIDRNLILVHKVGSSGNVKYCKIHDLLRDLCLREGKESKFLWGSVKCHRRISFQEGESNKYYNDRVLEATPSVHSLICDPSGYSYSSWSSLRLVRVFIMGRLRYIFLERDVFKLVNSRFLNFKTMPISFSIPIFSSSIHILWNLQILIIDCPLKRYLSPEFWKMSQIRYVHFRHNCVLHLQDVPLIHEGDDELILINLHTLKGIKNLRFSEEVIKRIPNIKKLQVAYIHMDERRLHDYCLNYLGLLSKLESLSIGGTFCAEPSSGIGFLWNFAFPHSLKKLSIYGTYLLWEDMWVIGSLPHLQVLKLKRNSFLGTEWNPIEGEFLCLKYLLIEYCDDLIYWNANNTHFPCLEQLALKCVKKLEIPLDIGQISTLRSIELHYCSNSTVMSAKYLLNAQVELGNEDLQFQVICSQVRKKIGDPFGYRTNINTSID